MSMLVGLLMVFIFGPAIAFLIIIVALRDLAEYYAGWLLPALFGIISGVQLKFIGPSDPAVPFESLVEVIAGSHLAGVGTPSILIAIGVLSLLAKPIYKKASR